MTVNVFNIFLFLLIVVYPNSYGYSTEPTVVESITNATLREIEAVENNDTEIVGNETDIVSTTRNPTTTEILNEQTLLSSSQKPNTIDTTSPVAIHTEEVTSDTVLFQTGSSIDVESTTVADELTSHDPQNDVTEKIMTSTPTSDGHVDSVMTTEARQDSSRSQTSRMVTKTTEDIVKTNINTNELSKIDSTKRTTTDSNIKLENDFDDRKTAIGETVSSSTNSKDHSRFILITGAVLAFMCFAILVAVGLLYYRRRQKTKQKVMMNFDLNRMDLRSIRHQPPNVLIVDFPLKKETDVWEEVKPMNSSVI